MAKVTSKLQVTVPKAIAERHRIRPGDEIEWVSAGDTIRVVPAGRRPASVPADSRLALFDAATARQRERQASPSRARPARANRGWTRDELYDRARPR